MAIATRPKRPTHYKKRAGKHHRHSQPYLKTYWPYIPMLMIVGGGILVNSLWMTRGTVLGASSDFSSNSLLNATNADRTAKNEPGLKLNNELAAAAQAKAEDMVKQNYWSHNSPAGRSPWSFINAAGYFYSAAGENLAYGFNNATDTEEGWMNSPEHRANVLNTSYLDVGFGVASTQSYQNQGPATVVVAEYGRPVSAGPAANFSTPSDSTPTAVPTKNTELSSKPVSRIQILTGGKANWSLMAVSAIAGAAFAIFVVRNGLRLHHALSRGEEFVAHHPYLDIAIVFVMTAGFVLTRTTGLIR